MTDSHQVTYIARPQFLGFHARTARWAAMICHRRCGKTHSVLMDLLLRALRYDESKTPSDPPGRYAYLGPYYNQAKTVAWDMLKGFARPFQAQQPNEAELRIDLIGGSRISLYGADNPDRLRGLGLNGVVLDEYADMLPSLFSSVIRPALADRGGFATIIGTVRGRANLWALYEAHKSDPSWFCALMTAASTGQLSPQELASSRQTMGAAQFAAEFMCDPYAEIQGAIYGQDMAALEAAGRITTLPPEAGVPVHTAWDLGHRHSTAIWFFQVVGAEIRVIDFYMNNGKYADHYCAELNARPYEYGSDYVPHDAKVHEWGTGKTRIETLQSLGRRPVLIPEHKIEDGQNAVHLMLERTWFDANRCKAGLEALRQHRVDYDEKNAAFKKSPKEDWTSDIADAFRYAAMAWREIAHITPERPRRLFKSLGKMSYREYSELDLAYDGKPIIQAERRPWMAQDRI